MAQIANMADAGWYLREHRKALGLTLQALAGAAEISVGYLSDLESGKRRHNSDWIAKFASILQIEPDALFRPPGATAEPLVPIIGFVGADNEGTIVHADGQRGFDMTPVPPGGTPKAVALEVRGHSMPWLAEDGALVYYENQHTPPTEDMIGYYAIMELDDGRVLIKRLLRGSRPGLFSLMSQVGPPIEDVRIRWAAEPTAIIPPKQAQRIIRRAGERQVA